MLRRGLQYTQRQGNDDLLCSEYTFIGSYSCYLVRLPANGFYRAGKMNAAAICHTCPLQVFHQRGIATGYPVLLFFFMAPFLTQSHYTYFTWFGHIEPFGKS